MQQQDVILIETRHIPEWESLVHEAFQYAVISKPFTIRRIGRLSLTDAIGYIFKGKLAELVFRWYGHQQKWPLDWERCATPFWKIDERDFLYDGIAWDIKNNFLHRFDQINPILLPCLVPNRHMHDQWSKRLSVNGAVNTHIGFVFTFMEGVRKTDSGSGQWFFEFLLHHEQVRMLEILEQKFKGIPTEVAPFSSDEFWRAFETRGTGSPLKLHFYPRMLVTSYSTHDHWSLFADTFPGMEAQPAYLRSNPTNVSFQNGALFTKIKNATCFVHQLPAVSQYFKA